jgi:hypothetical protein
MLPFFSHVAFVTCVTSKTHSLTIYRRATAMRRLVRNGVAAGRTAMTAAAQPLKRDAHCSLRISSILE